MNPTELVDRYFASVRSRDLESLVALFAEGAAAVLPDGRALADVQAIRAMYQHIFSLGEPTPTPLVTITAGNCAATEIETRLPDGSSCQTANFFQLDAEGRIVRLSVYKRD